MEKTLTWVRAILSTTVARWQGLADAVPVELLERKPTADEWSARECLRHILDTEQHVFPPRIRAFLAGEDFPGFDPSADGSADSEASTADMVAELARQRTANLTLLSRLTEEDLSRTARHSELGEVTLKQMLHEWGAHDLDHTIQAERSIMQPFILGCGPWRGYFKSQDMNG